MTTEQALQKVLAETEASARETSEMLGKEINRLTDANNDLRERITVYKRWESSVIYALEGRWFLGKALKKLISDWYQL